MGHIVNDVGGVLKRRVADVLNNYKRVRKLSQMTLADELGVSQTTMSRVLNGKLVFSDELLERISTVVGIQLEDLTKISVHTTVIAVRSTLSGVIVDKEIPVALPEIIEGGFALEVDKPLPGIRVGTLIIVSDVVTPGENDNVVLKQDNSYFYGVLEYRPDMCKSAWMVAGVSADGDSQLREVTKQDTLYYVSGLHYPKSEKREFSL